MFNKKPEKTEDKVKESSSEEVKSDSVKNNVESVDSKTSKPEEKAPDGQMFIKVYSPFKSYFDAIGTSISAANDTGEFDILVGHHRFLTLLSACEIIIRVKEGEEGEKIKIDRGIMYVKEDRVTVFLDV